MNKLNKSAYMFLIWAAFLCCGCGGAQRTKMYLEAWVQDERESGTGQDTSALEKSPDVLEDGSLPEQEETQSCFVYVCGAVKRPGVYELPKGSRVYEALALAGGLRKDAYEKEINQAEPVEDGQRSISGKRKNPSRRIRRTAHIPTTGSISIRRRRNS